MMKKTKFFALLSLVAVFGVLLSACGTGSNGNGGELNGTSWTLTSLNGSPLGEGSSAITLSFTSETEIGGNAGCNGYGGTYSAQADGSISFSELVSTMMACEPQIIMENEAAFLAGLNAATHYNFSGDTLTIDNGAQILIFTRS